MKSYEEWIFVVRAILVNCGPPSKLSMVDPIE